MIHELGGIWRRRELDVRRAWSSTTSSKPSGTNREETSVLPGRGKMSSLPGSGLEQAVCYEKSVPKSGSSLFTYLRLLMVVQKLRVQRQPPANDILNALFNTRERKKE